MKVFIAMVIGAVLGAFIIQRLMIEQHEYEISLYQKDRIDLMTKLAKCNGITARINKDSTMWVKK